MCNGRRHGLRSHFDWMVQILTSVASAIVIGVLAFIWGGGRAFVDRQRVYQWLRDNTRDEPGESHETTAGVAKGVRIPEIRARTACFGERRIFRYVAADGGELWSVWREEPQSIYEKAGLLIGDWGGGMQEVGAPPPARSEWLELEGRFERISGEIQALRMTFVRGAIEWSVHPQERQIRWLNANATHSVKRFEAEARSAARLWRRQYGRVNDRGDLLVAWIELLVQTLELSPSITGTGTDSRGQHEAEWFKDLVDASKVACARFASEIE